MLPSSSDTIVAPATATGAAALGIIRLSGRDAFKLAGSVFYSGNEQKDLSALPGYTVHFGTIRDGETVIDEVLLTVFRNPASFTGEDSVEISCHGSPYIRQAILNLLIARGARLAKPGEFTQRAFLNGKMDLSQAEAVADLIASESEAAHKLAMHQMRGGFSKEIDQLRGKLIDFASLVELELDFAEEDVEFANRDQLRLLIREILLKVDKLIQSFQLGNVIKTGVPIVIAGKPNAGKSTLLNALLNEEKAIVSDIAGTTRDIIEDTITIDGILFRFIDTAGLRETADMLEAMGIERTRKKIREASLLLYIFDVTEIFTAADYDEQLNEVRSYGLPFLMVGNKTEVITDHGFSLLHTKKEVVLISAREHKGLDDLRQRILDEIHGDRFRPGDTILTNARHVEALRQTRTYLQQSLDAIDSHIPGDLMAMDLRQALYHLGEITGQVTADDLLGNIFGKFCIGK